MSGAQGARHRKLSDEQLVEAVRMYRDLEMSVGQVAEYFGVTRQAMWDRLRKRTEMRPQLRFGQDNHFHRGGVRSNGRAHDLTEKAILRGDLVRPDDCETCGVQPGLASDGRSLIQAHHCDYNRPLDVMWLCQPCHHEWHRNNVPVELAS